MDCKGGACITRYPGSGPSFGFGEISYGMSKVDRIMLKFRPIAPKPLATGSGSSSSTAEHSDSYTKTRRRKRKYVKKNTTTPSSKKQKVRSTSSSENSGGAGEPIVTLSLMPETPDRKENSPAPSSPETGDKPSPVVFSSFNNSRDSHVMEKKDEVPPRKAVVTSLVTVECVTETWMNTMNIDASDQARLGLGVSVSDQARVVSMEMDTCPSFVTNGRDTVVWTNKAYREMITGGAFGFGFGLDQMVVKKVNRVAIPVSHVGFTCVVKVTWHGKGAVAPVSVTAPCDVWRLRSGGYAWRLDVKAALCLGRYS